MTAQEQKDHEVILGRLLFCQNRNQHCRAGGFYNWIKAGVRNPGLHLNYGLPCVGGCITSENGNERIQPHCIFCGSIGN